MPVTTLTATEEFGLPRAKPSTAIAERAHEPSAVSWASILAGAAAAASLSLILLVLGTGLGLSAVSPWAQTGITAATFGVTTILWVTITQVVASGMGGYLAGRLRVKWVAVHTDEAYFRDTAHGFLAWAIASLATAALLGSTIGAIVAGGVQAGASVAGGAANAATTAAAAMTGAATSSKADDANGPMNYLLDSMFRKDAAATPAAGAAATGQEPATGNSSVEAARIFTHAISAGALPADDASYLGQMVAQRTGLAPADAEKRVNDTYTRAQAQWRDAQASARQAADAARKASSYGALWLFVSLLMGAFVASLAATVGGRQRDI